MADECNINSCADIKPKIAIIETKLDSIIETNKQTQKFMAEHIRESIQVRLDVHDNKKFREENKRDVISNTSFIKSMKWHLKALYASLLGVVGLYVKNILFK